MYILSEHTPKNVVLKILSISVPSPYYYLFAYPDHGFLLLTLAFTGFFWCHRPITTKTDKMNTNMNDRAVGKVIVDGTVASRKRPDDPFTSFYVPVQPERPELGDELAKVKRPDAKLR